MIALTQIGYSSKSRGIDGQFKVRVEDRFTSDLLKARALFINIDGSHVPFIIESAIQKKDIILSLENIANPEQVNAFLNKEIYLHDDEISPDSLLQVEDNHPLVGYILSDQMDNKIGTIDEIIEYPHQLLASISYKGKALLIPIHEDLILSLDEEGKSVQLEIAEGLMDL